MEENTNERNELNENNENVKLDFPAEKFWNAWIIASIIAMATSIIYVINAFMIIFLRVLL